MKNPVQKMLKAAGQMKNNPQLAQRVAQSPNKVNAIAAQMVIPEQQAMQNSKPIPHPVGSVLMQKLAQAQQAAMAAKMPQPSEGGIAQMAAKGGVLKFAGAGKVPKGRGGRKKTETVSQQKQREFLETYGGGPSPTVPTDPMVEAFNAARDEYVDTQVDAANRQRQQALGEGIGKYQEALTKQERVRPEVEGLKRIGKNVKAPTPNKLQDKRAVVSDRARRLEEQRNARLYNLDPISSEELPHAMSDKMVDKFVAQQQAEDVKNRPRQIYEQTKRDIFRNKAIQKDVDARNLKKEAAANALKTQEGRNKPKPKLDGTPRVTAESRRQQADILRENNKKSSVIGAKGEVVPRQPATPKQKAEWDKAATARKARRAKVSSELGLPEKGGIASAASEESKAYLEAEKPVLTPASPAEVKRPTTRAKQKYSELTTAEKTGQRSSRAGIPTNKGPGPAVSGKATPAAPAEVEAPASTMPSKKKPADVTQGEATARLKKAKAEGQAARGETPATVHSNLQNATMGVLDEDSAVHSEIANLAQTFKSQNPDATVDQMGTHIIDNASEATKAKFLDRVGPMLKKYGVISDEGVATALKVAPKVMKTANVVGTADALGDIYDVYSDPTKTKGDVINQAAGSAMRGIGTALGSFGGAGAGVALGGIGAIPGSIAGGIGGYEAADYGVKKLRSTFGLPEEDPSATSHGGYHKALQGISDTTASPVSYIKAGESQAIDLGVLNERRKAAGLPPVTQQQLNDIRKERMGAAAAQSEPPAVPSDSAPQGQAPQGQASQGQASQGQAPQGQAPQGQAPQGQAPQGRAPAGQTVGYQPSASGAAAPSVPQATRTETQATQDQYAGDTSEATPEGAVRKLMELRGSGYSYSPEVMGMLKDARDEDRQATALSMLAGIGAGLANRDRYAGAHDAALLANQAFTSGREREDAAQQRFLQGIIHNEQVPFEQRQAAYEMYAKMQMAAAQNAALYGRALLNADTRRYGYNMGYAGRVASGGGRDWAEKQDIEGLHIMLKSIDKELESNPNDPFLTAQAKEIRNRLANLSGLSGGKELGQTAQKPIDLDIR